MQDANAAFSPAEALLHELGNIDLYLLDAVMKGHYPPGTAILDAGCGEGRNMHWFLSKGYAVWGVDNAAAAIRAVRSRYGQVPPSRFVLSPIEDLPFESEFFDAVISSAVLHFAEEETHFFRMLAELIRVLKPGGHLFIRMATDIGIEERVVPVGAGVYALPDGSTRFLLTRPLLTTICSRFKMSPLEEPKSVNVNDVRSMCALLLQKRLG